jgi:hypothetical protein
MVMNVNEFRCAHLQNSKTSILRYTIPLLIEPISKISFDEVLALIRTHKKILLESMAEQGALLFRQFPIQTYAEKRQILRALGITLETHYPFGISPRTALDEGVFKSTEVPNPFPLAAHTEMSYLPFRPGIIAFHCALAPLQYGETPLFDMRAVWEQLCDKTKAALREKNIHYKHSYPRSSSFLSRGIGLTWPSMFKSDDKHAVSLALEQQGFDYRWGKNDRLEYTTAVPSVIRHPVTQIESLNLLLIHPYVTYRAFAQLRSRQGFLMNYGLLMMTLLYSVLGCAATSVFFSDNQKIPYAMVKEICDLTWDNACLFPWQQNDLLLVDNIAIAHGRMNVVGPRKITVSLGNLYRTVS